MIVVCLFVLNNVVWADPDCLSPQSSFNLPSNPLLFHEMLIKAPLKYFFDNIEDIEKCDLKLTPPIYSDIDLTLDFSKKYKEKDKWIVPCELAGKDGVYPPWCYEAVYDPETKDIYVIFLSSRTSPSSESSAKNAGGDEWMFKPFEPSELRARVKKALGED